MRYPAAAGAVLLVATSALAQDAGDSEQLDPKAVAEKVGAAVVLIEARTADGTGQGTGFLVDSPGVVATALHVLDQAVRVTVTLSDGTEIEDVSVRAFDVARDLAVLVVPEAELAGRPTIALDHENSSERGDEVVVISSPLGLEQTLSKGIVSAWRLPKSDDDRSRKGQQARLLLPDSRMLQIDASVSPGSSGGPVLNARAEAVGVASSGVLYGRAGINFAVPAGDLQPLLESTEAMDFETFQRRADLERLELAEPYLQQARIDLDMERTERALEQLSRALMLYPRYVDALVLSGSIAIDAGLLDLAEEQFTAAVRADRDSAEAWYRLGTAKLAQAREKNQPSQVGEAEAAYRRAVGLDERHARASFELATIVAADGRLAEAVALARAAKDADPELAAASYLLGEIAIRRGDPEEAEQQFEEALWVDEDHAMSHLGLALIHTYQGDERDAVHHLRRFFELSKDDPELAEERREARRIVDNAFPGLID